MRPARVTCKPLCEEGVDCYSRERMVQAEPHSDVLVCVQVAARRLQAVGGMPACDRADVAVADGMRLPYRTQSLDAVLCIAVSTHGHC